MLGLGLGLTNFGTRGGVSDVPDALSGASSLLDGEDGLAIAFEDQSIAIRDTTTPANNISSAGTVRNGALVGPGAKITYTSPSPKLCKRSDGTYGYRAQNLYLNSEAPANQSVTVVSGLPYIIAVTGTVSITLSGAATGTVTTGNPITFTASSGTLTCGSTSGAGTVHLRSTLAATDYIATTSAPLYDLPYDWTGTYYYPLVEPAATNLGTFSRTWPVHANYLPTNITRTQVDGIDGVANSAYAFEATANNANAVGYVLESTVLDTQYTRSIFMKRLTGSGPVYVAPNGWYGWKGDGTETVTGSNKISNGDFASNVTGWTVTGTPDGSNYFSWNAGGYADFASTGGITAVSQDASGLTPGKIYRLTAVITVASGSVRLSVTGGGSGRVISASGTYHVLAMADSGSSLTAHFSRSSGTLVCTIDDVVVQEVTSINCDVSSQLVANEWKRVTVPSYVAHGGASARLILIATSGDKIAVDQHQIETGAVATSPIITAGATVTRAVDNPEIPTNAFPYVSGPGTLYVKWRLNALSATAAQMACALGEDDNNAIFVQSNNSAGSFDAYIKVGGSAQGFNTLAGVTANAIHRQAFAFATNDTAHVVNGGAPITDATVTLPAAATKLKLGRQFSAVSPLRGHMLEILYVPRRMSDAELQALTA